MRAPPLVLALPWLAAAALAPLPCPPGAAAGEPPGVADDGSDGPRLVVLADGATPLPPRLRTLLEDRLSAAGQRVVTFFDGPPTLARARAWTRPPIDIALVVTLDRQVDTRIHTLRLETRLAARLVDLRDGRALGRVDLAADPLRRLRAGCDTACADRLADRQAAVLTREMAAHVAATLKRQEAQKAAHRAAQVPGRALVLKGFEPADLAPVEDYLRHFPGYRAHRVTRLAGDTMEIWLQDADPPGALTAHLTRMLDAMGRPGRVEWTDGVLVLRRAAADTPTASESLW